MRICFLGHRNFQASREMENKLISIIEEYTDGCDHEFFFGGYGAFDDFAFRCAKKTRSVNRARMIYVTPYITESYLKNQMEYHQNKYDEIIYPEIENTPLRFAISTRNKWMAKESDVVICYINHAFGGAYDAVKYAKSKEKVIINIGNLKI